MKTVNVQGPKSGQSEPRQNSSNISSKQPALLEQPSDRRKTPPTSIQKPKQDGLRDSFPPGLPSQVPMLQSRPLPPEAAGNRIANTTGPPQAAPFPHHPLGYYMPSPHYPPNWAMMPNQWAPPQDWSNSGAMPPPWQLPWNGHPPTNLSSSSMQPKQPPPDALNPSTIPDHSSDHPDEPPRRIKLKFPSKKRELSSIDSLLEANSPVGGYEPLKSLAGKIIVIDESVQRSNTDMLFHLILRERSIQIREKEVAEKEALLKAKESDLKEVRASLLEDARKQKSEAIAKDLEAEIRREEGDSNPYEDQEEVSKKVAPLTELDVELTKRELQRASGRALDDQRRTCSNPGIQISSLLEQHKNPQRAASQAFKDLEMALDKEERKERKLPGSPTKNGLSEPCAASKGSVSKESELELRMTPPKDDSRDYLLKQTPSFPLTVPLDQLEGQGFKPMSVGKIPELRDFQQTLEVQETLLHEDHLTFVGVSCAQSEKESQSLYNDPGSEKILPSKRAAPTSDSVGSTNKPVDGQNEQKILQAQPKKKREKKAAAKQEGGSKPQVPGEEPVLEENQARTESQSSATAKKGSRARKSSAGQDAKTLAPAEDGGSMKAGAKAAQKPAKKGSLKSSKKFIATEPHPSSGSSSQAKANTAPSTGAPLAQPSSPLKPPVEPQSNTGATTTQFEDPTLLQMNDFNILQMVDLDDVPPVPKLSSSSKQAEATKPKPKKSNAASAGQPKKASQASDKSVKRKKSAKKAQQPVQQVQQIPTNQNQQKHPQAQQDLQKQPATSTTEAPPSQPSTTGTSLEKLKLSAETLPQASSQVMSSTRLNEPVTSSLVACASETVADSQDDFAEVEDISSFPPSQDHLTQSPVSVPMGKTSKPIKERVSVKKVKDQISEELRRRQEPAHLRIKLNNTERFDSQRFQVPAVYDFLKEVEHSGEVYSDIEELEINLVSNMVRKHFSERFLRSVLFGEQITDAEVAEFDKVTPMAKMITSPVQGMPSSGSATSAATAVGRQAAPPTLAKPEAPPAIPLTPLREKDEEDFHEPSEASKEQPSTGPPVPPTTEESSNSLDSQIKFALRQHPLPAPLQRFKFIIGEKYLNLTCTQKGCDFRYWFQYDSREGDKCAGLQFGKVIKRLHTYPLH